jgi:hypothetical protein
MSDKLSTMPHTLSSLRSALCALRLAPRAMPLALCATRYAIFALLIFTPLARGSVQGWAVTIIQMVTLIALGVFLLEKSLTWNVDKNPFGQADPLSSSALFSIFCFLFTSLYQHLVLHSTT